MFFRSRDGWQNLEGIRYESGKPWSMSIPDPDAVNWKGRQSRPGYRFRGMGESQRRFYEYIQAKRKSGEPVNETDRMMIRYLTSIRRWPEAPEPNAFWKAFMRYLRNLERKELTFAENLMLQQLTARGLFPGDPVVGPKTQQVIDYLNSGSFEARNWFERTFGRVEPWISYEMAAAGQNMASSGPAGDTFPGEPFNGMQIVYNVGGAATSKPADSFGFTTGRSYTGTLSGQVVSVSGSVVVGGYGADLTVRVWAGDKEEKLGVYVENKPGANSKSFNLSVPVPKGARTGGFTVRLDGRYSMGGGHRGLFVSGAFGPSAAQLQADRDKADREWRDKVNQTLKQLGYEETPEGKAVREMREALAGGDSAWKRYTAAQAARLGSDPSSAGRSFSELRQAMDRSPDAVSDWVRRQGGGSPPAETKPKPPTPPADPPSSLPDIGGLQIGTGTADGKLQGASDRLPPVPSLVTLLSFDNIPAGTEAEAVWMRAGREISRSKRPVGETGWVSFSLRAGAGNLAPGSYTVTINLAGKIVGRRTIVVG